MAQIGLKYLVFAPITQYNEEAAPTYGAGFVVGKAIKADLTLNFAEGKLYADDVLAEYSSQYQDGTIAVGVDEIEDEQRAAMFGYKIETESGTPVLKRGAKSIPVHGGFGYYKTHVKNKVNKYISYWFLDTCFKDASESAATKADSITFNTPEITGTILPIEGYGEDLYLEQATFDTEEAAKTWLKTKANIASARMVSVQSTAPVTTTSTTSVASKDATK